MREYALNQRLRRLGLDPLWYYNQLAIQGQTCAICKSDNPGGRSQFQFHIDHDHRTGLTRGLLCNRCNIGLGCFLDTAEFLELAAQYVRQYA